MAEQTSPTSSRRSWLENNLPHNPSHQSRTPTTLISSKLHHRHQPSYPHHSQSPRLNNIKLHRLPTHILLLILLTCIVPLTKAATIYIPEQMVETPKDLAPPAPEKPEDLGSALARLAQSAPILVDLTPPPQAAHAHDWTLATVAEDLKRRQVGGDDSSESTSRRQSTKTKESSTAKETESADAKTTSSSTQPSSTTSKSSSTESIAVAEETGSSPLPQIFDNGFSANITDSCASFMSNMLQNETFKACLPFSLLLQNSNTFFQTTKSVLLTTRLLDYTCAADTTLCTSVLDSFAKNITEPDSCASDISNGNPLIAQAYLGLQAYTPLYTASCLRNSKTSSYCFADAVTNKSSPSDGYVYYLPLNVSLPGGSAPTCSGCLKDTMAIFGGSDNEALRHTYVAAAQMVNVQCGPGFVNASLAVPVAAGGSSTLSPSSSGTMGLIALLLAVGSWLL